MVCQTAMDCESVGGATVVGGAGHAVAGPFTAAIVAQLALLELAGVGAIALLLFTLFFGTEVNGAGRWIRIPFVKLTFQSSDFA